MLTLMSQVIQLLAELKRESNLPGSEAQVLIVTLCRSIHVFKIDKLFNTMYCMKPFTCNTSFNLQDNHIE